MNRGYGSPKEIEQVNNSGYAVRNLLLNKITSIPAVIYLEDFILLTFSTRGENLI